jgi:hypothetical protein
MSTNPTQFIYNVTLSDSAAQIGIYETPVLSVDKVYEILFCNTSASPVSVDIWLVPSGGSRQAANKIIDAQSFILGAGETKQFGMEQRLLAGAQIHGNASVASVVSVHVAGDRISG